MVVLCLGLTRDWLWYLKFEATTKYSSGLSPCRSSLFSHTSLLRDSSSCRSQGTWSPDVRWWCTKSTLILTGPDFQPNWTFGRCFTQDITTYQGICTIFEGWREFPCLCAIKIVSALTHSCEIAWWSQTLTKSLLNSFVLQNTSRLCMISIIDVTLMLDSTLAQF